MVLLILLVVGVVFGFLGVFVATQKRRSDAEGFFLGFLFGPLGVLIEALLPADSPSGVPRGSGVRPITINPADSPSRGSGPGRPG